VLNFQVCRSGADISVLELRYAIDNVRCGGLRTSDVVCTTIYTAINHETLNTVLTYHADIIVYTN